MSVSPGSTALAAVAVFVGRRRRMQAALAYARAQVLAATPCVHVLDIRT